MKRMLLVPFLAFMGVASAWGGDPGVVEEYRDLRLMIGRQQFAEAMVVCRSLIERCPANIPLYEALVEVGLYSEQLDDVYRFLEDRIITGMNPEYAYFGTGLVHYNKGDYKTSVLHFDKAIALGLSAPECYRTLEYAYEKTSGGESAIRFFTLLCHRDPDNANHWYGLALAYWDKRDAGKIFRYLDNALQRRPDEPVYLQARAAAMSLLGNETKALKLMITALSRSFEQADYQGFFFVQAHLVQLLTRLGQPAPDKFTVESLIKMARNYGFYRWQGWGFLKLADLKYVQGDFVNSNSSAKRALTSSRLAHDRDLRHAALVRSFETNLQLDRLADALDDCLQRATLAEEEGDALYSLRAMMDLSRTYYEAGKYDLALEYASEALSSVESFRENAGSLAQSYAALGLAYRGLGRTKDALYNFEMARRNLSSNRAWDFSRSDIAGEIGRCFLLMHQTKRARQTFREQFAIGKELNSTPLIAAAVSNQGDCFLEEGKLAEAQRSYWLGLNLSRKIQQGSVSRQCMRGLAEIAERQGNLRAAVNAYAELLRLWNDGEKLCLDDIPYFGISNDLRRDTHNLIRVLFALGETKEAFNVAEGLKLRESRNFMLTPVEHTLRGHEMTALEGRIDSIKHLHQGITALYRMMFLNRDQSPLSDRNSKSLKVLNDIARCELAYARSVKMLGHDNPSLRSLLHPVPEPLESIQSRLASKQQVLLEYVVLTDQVLMFVVSPDTISGFRIRLGSRALSALLSKVSPLLDSSRRPETVWNSMLADFDSKASRDLYQILVSPAESILNGRNRLVIVADNVLHYLPFEILCNDCIARGTTKTHPDAHFLVQDYECSYALSATLQPVLRSRGNRVEGLLLVGADNIPLRSFKGGESDLLFKGSSPRTVAQAPLQGVRGEINRIRRLFASETTDLLDHSNARALLPKIAAGFRVIHIASHADWDEKVPVGSTLMVSPGLEPSVQSPLMPSDLAEFDLNADLVVLSGCNTARWSASANDYGFIRSVLNAGAISAVGALWSIEDESTADLMERFYYHVREGCSNTRALQLAKIDLIQSGRKDPFYWGGIVLMGESIKIGLAGDAYFDASEALVSTLATLGSILFVALIWNYLPRVLPRRMVWEKKK